ncbi:MAG: ABC transporter ATP-binding protein [Prevotella sp.]|nr:ABC transporter ATP-binding protein [Prevotella sp.]
MIELKEGSISARGKAVVSSLSFVAPAGKVTCLTGASGSGKTLLLRALLGLWPLDKGYASLQGEPITERSAQWLRRLMAYVPQQLPETYSDALEAFHDLSLDEKRCLLVDDPFAEMTEERAAEFVAYLQAFAEKGWAVVLTCSESDVARFNPSVALVYPISSPV